MTVEPKASSWAILAAGAFSGTKMTLAWPTLAHRPLSAAAALPVLAVVMMGALRSWALTTAMALARSLNEALGLRPSSFTHTWCKPSVAASRGAS